MTLLADVVVARTYSKVKADGTKESWNDVCDRYQHEMQDKYPQLTDMIVKAVDLVRLQRITPSMRFLQFAMSGIKRENMRGYNCAFVSVRSFKDIADILYISMCGTGMGFSVKKYDIGHLPVIKLFKEYILPVLDSKEGWSQSVIRLLENPMVQFDYSQIRKQGDTLSTGGTASGPEPLILAHQNVRAILMVAVGRKLTPIEVHSIVTHLADAVVVGGVRRSALISLFDKDEVAMLESKSNDWWVKNSNFARANNSVQMNRATATQEEFNAILDQCFESKAGEPGISWTNTESGWGYNPCCLPSWAEVLTPNGISKLENVDEGDYIWSGKQWTKILKKWSNGIKPVYKFETIAGRFYGTDDHKVFENGERVEVKEAEGVDICLGTWTPLTNWNAQDVMNGLVLGDGTMHKASNNLILLCIGEKDGDYHQSEISHLITKARPGVISTTWEITTDIKHLEVTYNRTMPAEYYYGSFEKKASFLRGLFSANGCVTAGRVQYKCASRKMAEQIQDMLSSMGMRSSLVINKPVEIKHHNGLYTSKESYNLILYNSSEQFMESIGFLQKYKTAAFVKNSKQRSVTSQIRSVEFVREEEVFDIMVEADEHSFWANGLLVSNCEISLRNHGTCNLTEINFSKCETRDDFFLAAWFATFLGTLQAGFTDFNYISNEWTATIREDALLGVSITGMAQNWPLMQAMIDDGSLGECAKSLTHTNSQIAAAIGINPAKRITTVKPSGTTSCVLDTTSGIHAAHAPYYLRRVRIDKTDPVAKYLATVLVAPYLEEDLFNKSNVILAVPYKMENAIFRKDETALQQLERAASIYNNWVLPGHVSGDNAHNVSLTCSYGEDEREQVKSWMWNNRNSYGGVSLLPRDNHSYVQAPFEEITEARYNELVANLPIVDLSDVAYTIQDDTRSGEVACAGGSCEIK